MSPPNCRYSTIRSRLYRSWCHHDWDANVLRRDIRLPSLDTGFALVAAPPNTQLAQFTKLTVSRPHHLLRVCLSAAAQVRISLTQLRPPCLRQPAIFPVHTAKMHFAGRGRTMTYQSSYEADP